MAKTVFLVAGESSGDVHGSNLIRALRGLDSSLEFEGLGGQRMAAAGMRLRHDLAGRAIMGFTEDVRSFGFIRTLFNETITHLEAHRPDVLVLIDYPGFNMRLGRRAKALGIPVVYYISPQVWAWKKGRVRTLASFVDKMLVILPFEEVIYREANVPCAYVGHPLLDHVSDWFPRTKIEGDPVIGLLPGSREQEIRRILPPMIETAKGIREKYPRAKFVTACVDKQREEQIRALAGDFPVETHVGGMYDVLGPARFCMVASGTATVEAALFGVPFVILYRVTPVTYWMARMLVDIEHIGMVNILAGKRLVPEFVQGRAAAREILPTALTLIDESPERRAMIGGLAAVREVLGGPGASERAAREILTVINR